MAGDCQDLCGALHWDGVTRCGLRRGHPGRWHAERPLGTVPNRSWEDERCPPARAVESPVSEEARQAAQAFAAHPTVFHPANGDFMDSPLARLEKARQRLAALDLNSRRERAVAAEECFRMRRLLLEIDGKERGR